MTDKRKDRVFLSYASEDLPKVQEIYEGLKRRGLDVWFDKEHLGPGKWKSQITRAITKSRYFVICISNAAIRKTGDEPGFQDEELNEAYDIAKNQPEQEFSIIPARIEDCDRGDHRLNMFQQYDLFDDFDKGLDRLAVDMGGISLSDASAKDERNEDQKLIDNLFAKAAAEYYAGKFMESIKLVDSILVFSPDNASAWANKGAAFIRLGQYEDALNACDIALKIDPDNATAYLNKGIGLTKIGRHDEALIAYDKASKIDPNNANAWLNKGTGLNVIGRHDEALVASDEALKINPDSATAWLNKGFGLTKIGRHDEALVAYDKASKIDPNNASAWAGIGVALTYLSRHEEALDAYDKVLKIDPDYVDIFNLRNSLMKQLKGND
jgi:tetratricopeptide (TPR) repeat protein